VRFRFPFHAGPVTLRHLATLTDFRRSRGRNGEAPAGDSGSGVANEAIAHRTRAFDARPPEITE